MDDAIKGIEGILARTGEAMQRRAFVTSKTNEGTWGKTEEALAWKSEGDDGFGLTLSRAVISAGLQKAKGMIWGRVVSESSF